MLTLLDGNDVRTHGRIRAARKESTPWEKKKKIEKTQGRKKKLIEILHSGGFGKTSQTTQVGEYPRRANKSW